MIKLTNIAITKCENFVYSTYKSLKAITNKNTLEELKILDFTPYIPVHYLNKISKVNLNTNESRGTIKFYHEGTTIWLDANNFYYTDCEECKNSGICNNTTCINYAVCN